MTQRQNQQKRIKRMEIGLEELKKAIKSKN